MSRVTINLEEQLSDSRSNELAYRLTIDNLGSNAISLSNVSPRIPDGVELVEVKDFSSQAAKLQHESLCKELTELLRDQIMLKSEEVRDQMVSIERDMLRDTISDLPGFWRVYLKVFTGQYYSDVKSYRSKRKSLFFTINSLADSKIAIQKWFPEQEDSTSISDVYRAKHEQLQAIEEEMNGDGINKSSLAVIEPDSLFATTYVFKFPRSLINPTRFSISIEATIRDSNSHKDQLLAASTNVIITPKPYILSLIAIASSLLGTILKFTTSVSTNGAPNEFFRELGVVLITASGISAAILALVIFNIYEYLDIGGRIRIGVGWRSALFVGVLCGLFSSRMIEALQAIIG